MSRRPNHGRVRSATVALRDRERIVVAGPNAVEAVLDAVSRTKAGDGAAALATISAVHRVYLEDTAGARAA